MIRYELQEVVDTEWPSYLENFSEEDRTKGKDAWRAFESIDDSFYKNHIESIVTSSVYSSLDEVMGEGTEDYAKAVLADYYLDWISFMSEDIEEAKKEGEDINPLEEAIFFPGDMLKLFYHMTKRIVQQQTTIDNLRFALNHLSEEKQKDGDPS